MSDQLPVFPKFEKLSLDHKDLLRSITKNFPSSDFNFAGLFTWDVKEAVSVSSLNGNLVICSSDYLTHSKFYSLLGDNKLDETIQKIKNYANEKGELTKLRLVPDSVIKHIKNPELHEIKDDRDNYDYIYLVSDLSELNGGKYMKKRNILNGFNRNYGEHIITRELNLHNLEDAESIKQVMGDWQKSRNKSDEEVSDEMIAVQKALNHHETLGMRAFGSYYKHKLIAFNLFEILPNKVAIAHFHKADTNFVGVYEHLTHNFAKHLSKMNVVEMNYEQDLGIEGLRRSKESFHPHRYIKKYIVERIK